MLPYLNPFLPPDFIHKRKFTGKRDKIRYPTKQKSGKPRKVYRSNSFIDISAEA